MIKEINFYLFILFQYSFYCFASYKFVRQNIIDETSRKFINKYGLRWEDNEELVISYGSKIEKWGIGTIFYNEGIFRISIFLSLFLFYKEFVYYGFLGILLIIIACLFLQFIIGQIFKGYGIQYSTFISLTGGLFLLIFKSMQ